MNTDVSASDKQGAKILLVFVPITIALTAASLALHFMPGVGGALIAIGCLAVLPLSLLLIASTKWVRLGALVLTLLYLGIIVGVLILQASQ
jgi:hypothetical protein